MNPYKTSHTVVTPQGTYTTTLEFTPAAESAPEVSPIKDDLIDAAIANWWPPIPKDLANRIRPKAQEVYNSQTGSPAVQAEKAVGFAVRLFT